MCGIAGLWSSTPQGSDALTATARAMSTTLRHRGPDGEGVWVDERHGVALGHRRLAVIDLTPTGAQPMTSASGRWTITFNGEIYNHPDLRRELQSLGVTFRGTSDTEVLCEAIDRWGLEQALRRSDAMFALAAWDASTGRLFLARDRFGEKPLYHCWAGDDFVFGSELRALRRHPSFTAEPDLAAVRALIEYGYVPAPASIYADVSKLEPGSIGAVDVRTRRVDVTRWWDAARVAAEASAQPFTATPSDAADTLEGLIRESVARRMVADVPVGTFLSGGIDSSLVVALASSIASVPVRSFTIGFDRREYDEAPFAAAVARHLGTEHHASVVSEREALTVVPRLADLWDEPFADSSQIPTYLVAGVARREVTVALSGDGGDELFGGYDRYRLLRPLGAAGRVGAIPVIGSVLGAGVAAGAAMAGRMGRDRTSHRLAKLGRVLTTAERSLIYRELVYQWPDPPVHGAARIIDPLHAWQDVAGDGVASALAVDTVSYLPDDILVKVDRATMAHSLEGRIPLLTDDIFRFAWSLPPEHRWAANGGKAILKRVLQRHVPRTLFERPKQGFGVPMGRWLRSDLGPWAAELIEAEAFERGGFFDVPRVRDTWSEHCAGRVDHAYRLWPVLVFEAWRREHHPDWTL